LIEPGGPHPGVLHLLEGPPGHRQLNGCEKLRW
jgi:hypothetical protein